MKKQNFSKNISYLRKNFYIDLWNDTLKKKNWKRSQTKKLLVRYEKFYLLGSFPLQTRRLKRKKIFKKVYRNFNKLKFLYRQFKVCDTLFKQQLVLQKEFEVNFFLNKLLKLKKFAKNLELKKNNFFFKQNIYFSYFNNYFNFFYLNNFRNQFYKKILLNPFLNLKLKKYVLYSKRFLPTKLWKGAFLAYYVKKKKKPKLKLKKHKIEIIYKRKILKILTLSSGFFSEKKFAYLKNNIFQKNIYKRSAALYITKLLINLLYSTNFFRKFRQAYLLLKINGALLNFNKKPVKTPYKFISVNTTISFNNIIKISILKLIFNNLKNNYLILTNSPFYLEINLKILTIVLWREPLKSELNYINSSSAHSLLQWF